MFDLDESIALAMCHVEQGRHIVARQRELIALGTAGAEANKLLATFEQSQDIFEQDLARLLKDRHGIQKRCPPIPKLAERI